jgi:hypothetical protein
MARKRALLVLTLAAALGASAVAAQDSSQDAGFDADERRRLDAGELVAHPVTRYRGRTRLIGGSSFQLVERSPAATWRALMDVENLHHMLPAGEASDVVARTASERIVRLRHNAGIASATYHLRLRYDHERRDISFRLDDRRTNDLSAAWGFLSVTAIDGEPDRALVSWGVMADLGMGMLGGVLRGTVHEWLMRVPSTIRDYLQGAARDRYDE